MKCESEFVIDFDSLYCELEKGHEEMHVYSGEHGKVEWRLFRRPKFGADRWSVPGE